MSWLIIGIALVILIYFIFRAGHLRHRLFLVLAIFLLVFIYFTASRVLSGHDINWKSVEGISKGTRMYFSWLGSAFSNAKALTKKKKKMDWSPNNTKEVKVSEKKTNLKT